MLTKVVSGGQSGTDLAAWRAARRFGISTGGWVPKGFLTEDGPRPEFAALYGAREHESPEYPPRTRANVAECDGALVFSLRPPSPGTALTLRLLAERARGWVGAYSEVPVTRSHLDGCWYLLNEITPATVSGWLERMHVEVLLVAGPRESKAPGIGAWVESYLAEVFRLLGHEETK